MFPKEFTERLYTQSSVDASSLLQALGESSPVSLRLNRAKWKGECLLRDTVAWEKDGFYLRKRPVYTLDPLFHAGVYYPQEASSMFAGEAFRQVTAGAGPLRVLDLCAAPGGKSTHISSLLKEDDLLVANEVIRPRAAVLAGNITRWGLGNTIVTQNDPSAFTMLPSFFDVILVDAPCSGEGMFRDSTAVSEWSPSNARLCSERQRRILMDVWGSLKPGGVLIYSTCTFNPAENEENVLWFTETAGAETVRLNTAMSGDITTIKLGNTESYAFYPGKVKGDGFFLSVMRKTQGDSARSHHGKSRTKRSGAKAPSDVRSYLATDSDRLIVDGGKVLALATDTQEYEIIATALNVVKAGTMAGEMVHGRFIPSHDLAMSAHINRELWPAYDAGYDEALTYLRMDDFIPQKGEQGRMLICYRNVPLGFINHLGKRVNNCYPTGWRIRMEKKGIFEDIL